MPGGKPPARQNQQKKRSGYPAYGSNYAPYSGSGSGSNFNKKKRPNPSNTGEYTEDPPIDSLYRILCPIRKIGSVLGRGGDIIKSLRAETNSKILVADPVPGSDDRVVIIYSLISDRSNETAVQDQDPSNERATSTTTEDETAQTLKPLCPAQDALLKVNDRIAADELYHGGGEEIEVTARILIPRNHAGCVLGKGGTLIQQMRRETGAGIKVFTNQNLPPCAMDNDELIHISGIPSVVKRALYEISTKLHINPRKEQPPLNEIIYTSTHGTFSQPLPPHHHPPPPPFGNNQWGPPRGPPGPPPPPSFGYDGGYRDTSAYGYGKKFDEFTVRVLCPAWRIGGIIGKQGSNVRRLEEETGAHLQVEETIADEERVLAVSAKETLSEAVSQTIKFLVQIQSNTSPSDESVVTKLLVPSQKVGCILGEGGNVINEMRRRTGASIRIYTKDIRPGFISPDDELLEIAGNPRTAREALIDVCTRLRTRTLRGGDAVPSGPPPFDYPPVEGGGFAPPHAGPGYPPPPGPGYPPGPVNHGYQPYPPAAGAPNFPPPAGGYPPDPSGYPPPAGGYPPPASGYAPPHPPSGYAPTEGGYPPATGYHGPPPVTGGYAPPPVEGGYAPPPVGGGYHPPPVTGSYPPPAGIGYPPIASGGYLPAGGEYPPPVVSSSYPTTAAESAYPVPAGGGYVPPQSAHSYPGPSGSGYPPHSDGGYGYTPPSIQGTNKSPVPPVSTVPPVSGYHGYPPQATAQVAPQAHETHRYAGQPAPTGYHAASGSLEIRIPTTAVEFVIGSDGSNINEIRKISGAKVTVRDPAPGSSECVVELLGSSEQIHAAQGLVHAYMAQQNQPKAEAPGQYPASTWS